MKIPFFSKKESKKSLEEESVPKPTALVSGFSWSGPQRPEVDYDVLLKMYKENVWARSCIDLIAKACVGSGYHFGAPFNVQFSENAFKTATEWSKQVNEDESLDDLLWDASMDLLTYGDAYWELRYKESSIEGFLKRFRAGEKGLSLPLALTSISAKTVQINADEHGVIRGYEQTPDGVNLERDKVVHFKLWSPGASCYGISPLESLQNTIATGIYLTEYNGRFFERNATPRLHINFPDVKDPETLRRATSEIEAHLKGKPEGNLITGGKCTVSPVSTRESESFTGLAEHLKQEVFSAFSIPPTLFGPKGASERDLLLFKNLAVKPLQKIIASRINQRIFNGLLKGELKIEFTFNPVDTLDLREQIEIDEKDLKNQVRSVNEIRASRGLQKAPWSTGKNGEDKVIIPWSRAREALLPGKEENEKKGEEEKNSDKREDGKSVKVFK